MAVAIKSQEETFTPRQQAVLTAALGLLVEGGDPLRFLGVAAKADGVRTAQRDLPCTFAVLVADHALKGLHLLVRGISRCGFSQWAQ